MPAKKHQHKSQGKDYVAAHYKDFADRIITQIKAGTAPWQKPWELGEKVLPQSVSHRPRISRRELAAPHGCCQ